MIDTPAVTKTSVGSDTLDSDCIKTHAHGVHGFLLVFRLGRFTEEERDMVKWVKTNLGEEGLKFSIVLFTGGDQLEGKPVEAFVNESPELQSVVQSCAGGYHVFNNRERQDESQVTDLLEKIEGILSKNKGVPYTNEMYTQVQRKEAEWVVQKDRESTCEEREKEMRAEEEKRRQEEKRRVREMERVRREMKVRDLKDEEECKRGKLERKIRREERERRERESWSFFFYNLCF